METSENVKPQVVPSGWIQEFEQLLATTNQRLLIVSPFVRFRPGVERLIEIMKERGKQSSLLVHFVTDFSTQSLAAGATDPRALIRLIDAMPGTTVTYLRRVHAKVYVADETAAIVTSGNLTAGGLLANYEYGVQLTDRQLIRKLIADLESYASRGSILSREDLVALATKARQLRSRFKALLHKVDAPVCKAFHSTKREFMTQLQNIRNQGKTLTEQFAEAIVFLLSKYGPMDTQELYDRLKRHAPELCTDRGQERPFSVWQRDARNALTKLQEKEKRLIELIPTEGYERKGVYRLLRGSS